MPELGRWPVGRYPWMAWAGTTTTFWRSMWLREPPVFAESYLSLMLPLESSLFFAATFWFAKLAMLALLSADIFVLCCPSSPFTYDL